MVLMFALESCSLRSFPALLQLCLLMIETARCCFRFDRNISSHHKSPYLRIHCYMFAHTINCIDFKLDQWAHTQCEYANLCGTTNLTNELKQNVSMPIFVVLRDSTFIVEKERQCRPTRSFAGSSTMSTNAIIRWIFARVDLVELKTILRSSWPNTGNDITSLTQKTSAL